MLQMNKIIKLTVYKTEQLLLMINNASELDYLDQQVDYS